MSRFCAIHLIVVCLVITNSFQPATADEAVIRFDVPAMVAATAVEDAATTTDDPNGAKLWSIPLELSTLVVSANAPKIDQILLEIDLQDPTLLVADFNPRTVTASPYASDIAVEQCDESTGHLGVNATGSYPSVGKADIGGDLSKKQSELKRYSRIAPVEIVAASGTTGRRHGVFFKLRSTATQVLEGDKAVEVVIAGPANWRQGLLRVRVRAQAANRSLPGISPGSVTLADQTFLVAAFRADDFGAEQSARDFVSSLQQLQRTAREMNDEIRKRSAPTVFHQVVNKLELAQPRIPTNWLSQVVFGNADLTADKQLRRLPVDVRIAVLDFQDAKEQFVMNHTPAGIDAGDGALVGINSD